MSDFNSSLPVRTESNGDVVSRISDGTITSRLLTINADGSINVVTTGADLDIRDLSASQDNVAISDGTDTLGVNSDGSINVVATATAFDIRSLAFATDKVDVSGSNVTVDATDLDIRDLSHTQDSIKVGDGTDLLAINADGSLNSIITATDLDIRDLNQAQDSVASWINDGSGNAITSTSGALNVQVANTAVNVTSTDLDIRDLTSTTDSVAADLRIAGTSVSMTNPIPVVMSADQAGDEINNYVASPTVAAGASTNHDYVVTTGKTLLLQQVESSGSGKAKMEVQVETAVASGTFVTKFVQFNSTANPNMSLTVRDAITVPAGVRVRVTMTNRDNQPQDLYSTICGVEV